MRWTVRRHRRRIRLAAAAGLIGLLSSSLANSDECGNLLLFVRIRSVLSVRDKEDKLSSEAGTDAIASVLRSRFAYDEVNVSYVGRGDHGDADYQVAFVCNFTARGGTSAFATAPFAALLLAEAASGLAMEVMEGLPVVGNRVFSDRNAYNFTSLGGFAAIGHARADGTGFYVRPPRSDSATPDSDVMWRLWARVPVTVYLDFWGGESHAELPSWLRDVDSDDAWGGWRLRSDIEGVRFADESEVSGAGVVYSRDFSAGAIDIHGNGGNATNSQGTFVAFVTAQPDVLVASDLQAGEAFRAWRDPGLMDDLSRQLNMNVQGAHVFLTTCSGDDLQGNTSLPSSGPVPIPPPDVAQNESNVTATPQPTYILSRGEEADQDQNGGETTVIIIVVVAAVVVVLSLLAVFAIWNKQGAGLVNNAAPTPTIFGGNRA